MIVSEVIAAYVRHSAVESVHGETARVNRERVFRWFCALHGDKPVTQLRAFHLTDFVESQSGWRSVSTRRAGANMIKAAFRWAFDEERIDRHPFKKVRYAEAERRCDMPDDILDKLCRTACKPFEAAMRFLRMTGARLGEMNAAQLQDFDLERGVWIIHRHKTRKQTKKPRIVALVPECVTLIKGLAVELPAETAVFRNSLGQPWTPASLNMHLKRLKRRLAIKHPATLHSIRHRFGTCAVSNGAPLKLVSAQLGHASQATTEAYYVNLESEIEAIRRATQLAQRSS